MEISVFCIFKSCEVPLPLVCNRLCDMKLSGSCFGGLDTRSSFTFSTGLLWQRGIATSFGLENVFLSRFGSFFFWDVKLCEVVKSVTVLCRMCFSQVGNCDIQNACERVDIGFLGAIVILQPDGTVWKDVCLLLPDPVISNVLLWIWKFESGFSKRWQNTLCTRLACNYE